MGINTLQSVCEIITTGNELLIGKILNTNGRWLVKRITSLGGRVTRVTVIEDCVEGISSVLEEALKRKTNFIFTVGGLGPTFDDKTLEGVSRALNRSLKLNYEAMKMVEEKYRKFVVEGRMKRVDLTSPRIKMTLLPEGAEPLINPVGTAPGVLIKTDGTTIISLPGVPSEMKAIFEQSVIPLLKRAMGDMTFFEVSIAVTIMESGIAPIIDKVMRDNPHVYIKSHPKGPEKTFNIELHLSTTAEDPKVARNRVSKALISLSELVQKEDGQIRAFKANN